MTIKMKKILIISPDYKPTFSGVGTHVVSLVEHLSKTYDITVMTPNFNNTKGIGDNHYEINHYANCTHIDFNTNLHVEYSKYRQSTGGQDTAYLEISTTQLNMNFLEWAIEAIEELHIDFDLIHMHHVLASVAVVALKRIFNVPLISTIHTMYNDSAPLKDNLTRYTIFNSDEVICVSSAVQKSLLKYGFNQQNAHLIYNSIEKVSVDQNVCPQKDCFVFCGRLEENKNCLFLIHAYEEYLRSEKSPKFPLYILGDGTLKSKLVTYIKDRRLESRVVMLGRLNSKEVNYYYKRALAVLIPSKREAFSTVALEAMLNNTLVVSSNVGGFSELITDHENGIMINNIDTIDGFCNCLENISINYLHFETIARNGFDSAQRFTWDNNIKKIVSLYEAHLHR